MNSKIKSEKPIVSIPEVELQEFIGDVIKTGKFLEELIWLNGTKFLHNSLTKFPLSTCESPTDRLKLAQHCQLICESQTDSENFERDPS